MKTLKKIFGYLDYRKFLQDYFTEQKQLKKIFSFRYFAKKAGFNSPSFISYVLKGERNLSVNSIDKMVAGLGLKGKDAEYFKNLVFYNQTESVQEKETYFNKLQQLRKNTKFKPIDKTQIAFYQNWYYHVIRELIELVDWKNDYTLLAKLVEPNISPSQAKEAVETLLKIGLIEKKDGRYVQTKGAITAQGIPPFFIKKIRRKFLELGMDAIDNLPVEKRHFSSLTFSLSEEGFEEVSKILDEARKKIAAISISQSDKQKEKIFQVNLQGFPLSCNIKKDILNSGEKK